MLGRRSTRGHPQVPRHPEVHQERSTAFEPDNQILAAPSEAPDTLTFEGTRDGGGIERLGEARIANLDALEPAADEKRLELRADRLNFG
jgi:hypothetical protein